MPNGNEKPPIGWKELSHVLLAAGLLGFGARGAIGLADMLKRRITKPIISPEDEEQPMEPETVIDRPFKMANATKQAELHPALAATLAMGGGVGGFYGGWTLAKKLFEQRQKKELEDEIERAKKEYESTLLGKNVVAVEFPKTSAVLLAAMERHEKGLNKEAEVDVWKALPYAFYLVLAGLLTTEAYKAYHASRAASPAEQIISAEKRRRAMRVPPTQAMVLTMKPNPRQEFASATKLPTMPPNPLEREDELEESPTRGI